jgi:hypothetical protein
MNLTLYAAHALGDHDSGQQDGCRYQPAGRVCVAAVSDQRGGQAAAVVECAAVNIRSRGDSGRCRGRLVRGQPKSLVVSIRTTCFNIPPLCILPTQCICVFRMVLTINRDCFPKHH